VSNGPGVVVQTVVDGYDQDTACASKGAGIRQRLFPLASKIAIPGVGDARLLFFVFDVVVNLKTVG